MKSNPGPAGVEIGQIPNGLPAGLATAGCFHSGANTASMSEKGGGAAGLASGPDVAAGLGVTGGLAAGSEQAPTVATKPAPPASRSSRRRLTSCGPIASVGRRFHGGKDTETGSLIATGLVLACSEVIEFHCRRGLALVRLKEGAGRSATASTLSCASPTRLRRQAMPIAVTGAGVVPSPKAGGETPG